MGNKDITNLTFLELWEEYDDYLKIKLKKQSYRKEKNNYKNHILPYFKDYLVKEINSKIYLEWMNTIEEKEYTFSFKSSLHTCMVSILNYAVKFYELKTNIASRIGNFNKKKHRPKNIDFWTIEEYEKFISNVNKDLEKLLFNVLYFTGIRIGECLALTWNDFKDGYLDINKTISKEKENNQYIINSPKTLHSIRKIKLDSQLENELKKLYKSEKKSEDFKESWYIFGGTTPLSQTTISRHKNNYCEKANVKKIRLHDFRHSHATLLLSNGVPITVISQRLGHSDIAMTLNTYSHLILKDEDKAIDIIDLIKSSNSLIYS